MAVDAVGMGWLGPKSLDDHGAGSTSTVTDSRNTNLCIIHFQHTRQSRHYPRTGTTPSVPTPKLGWGIPSKWVSERDGTAENIDFIGTQSQNLAIGESDNTECFVDFKVIHFFLCDPSLFQRFGNSQRRRRGKRNRFLHITSCDSLGGIPVQPHPIQGFLPQVSIPIPEPFVPTQEQAQQPHPTTTKHSAP
jgi:hypothetical protein